MIHPIKLTTKILEVIYNFRTPQATRIYCIRVTIASAAATTKTIKTVPDLNYSVIK